MIAERLTLKDQISGVGSGIEIVTGGKVQV
jgi:hypothetical protein